MSSVRRIPQHCPVSTQCLLMTSAREKLICRPWEGPGLDIRSAEVKHIRLLTRHRFSLGKNEAITHRHEPAKLQTHSLLQKRLSSFQCFLFPRCVCFCLCEMQMEKNRDECLISNPFLSLILLLLHHKSGVTELLTHSHYVETLIKSGRHICFMDIWLHRNNHFKLSVCAVGWSMAAETKWLITEKFFSWRLTNARPVAGFNPGNSGRVNSSLYADYNRLVSHWLFVKLLFPNSECPVIATVAKSAYY